MKKILNVFDWLLVASIAAGLVYLVFHSYGGGFFAIMPTLVSGVFFVFVRLGLVSPRIARSIGRVLTLLGLLGLYVVDKLCFKHDAHGVVMIFPLPIWLDTLNWLLLLILLVGPGLLVGGLTTNPKPASLKKEQVS
jgi:hypothetical protein